MAGFNLTAQINLRGPANVKKVVAGIQKQLNGINANVNLNLNKNTVKVLADADKKLRAINASLGKVSANASKATSAMAQFANTLNSIGTGNVSVKIQSASKATQQLSNNAKMSFKNIKIARTEIEEFGRQSALAVRRFTAFASVTSVIYGVNNAINQALSDFIKFDRQLVRVSQVSGQAINNLSGLQQTIGDLASGIGVSSSSLAEISVTLSQAGFSIRDVQKALKALALTDVAPTFNNLKDTVEGSIALLRQFSIDAGQLESALGSINAVAAQFAVESSDIIAAIQRAGGVFAAASRGVSEGTQALNEFIAVFTSVRATTREGAETIATGLRTIFTRLQRESTIDALKEFGVNLQDAQGKFVGAYKAVQLLSEGLGNLDPRDIRFSQIVEELGGFRQIGKVIPLIGQFATAQDALRVAQQGQDSLAKSNAIAQQALAVQFAKVREEFLRLVRDIAGTDSFKGLISGALTLASALIKVADAVKSIVPVIALMGAVRGFGAITQFTRGFGSGLRRTQGFARGGTVPGSGNTDSVPAMLTPGEFVLRKSAVKNIGTENLHKMNNYSYGGTVEQLGKIYSSIPKKPGYEKIKNRKVTDRSIFKKIKPTKKDLDLWNSLKLPYGERFERILAAKIPGIGKPDSYKYAFLDFPDSKVEAKFMKRGQTYNLGENDASKKGNTASSIAAKNLLYENSLISGDTNKKANSLSTYALANKPVTTYWADPSDWIKKSFGGSTQDTVPAMLTPGEFVFNKESASRIGYGNLRKMNTRPQGFNKGGIVGFANGGGPTGVQGNRGTVSFNTGIVDEIRSLEQAFISLGLPIEQITKVLTTNGNVSRKQLQAAVNQSRANLNLAKTSAKSSADLNKLSIVEKTLSNVRAQSLAKLAMSNSSLGKFNSLADKFSGQATFFATGILATGAAIAESSNTIAGAGIASLLQSVTTGLIALAGALQTIQALQGVDLTKILGKIPGVGGIAQLIVPIFTKIGTAIVGALAGIPAAIAAVVVGIVGGYALVTNTIQAMEAKRLKLLRESQEKTVDSSKESLNKEVKDLDTDRTADSFNQANAALQNLLNANRALADTIVAEAENSFQSTTGIEGGTREFFSRLTFGWVDGIDASREKNAALIKEAAEKNQKAATEALQSAQAIVFRSLESPISPAQAAAAQPRQINEELRARVEGTQEFEAYLDAAVEASDEFKNIVASGQEVTNVQRRAIREVVRREALLSGSALDLKYKQEEAARAAEELARISNSLNSNFGSLRDSVRASANIINQESAARQAAISDLAAIASGAVSNPEIQDKTSIILSNLEGATDAEKRNARKRSLSNLAPVLGRERAREVSTLATFDASQVQNTIENIISEASPAEIRQGGVVQLGVEELLRSELSGASPEVREEFQRAGQQAAKAIEQRIGALDVNDPQYDQKRQQIIEEETKKFNDATAKAREAANETARIINDQLNSALNQYGKNLDQANRLQQEANKYRQQAIQQEQQNFNRLSQIMTGISTINAATISDTGMAQVAGLTGGVTDPAAIRDAIVQGEAQLRSLREQRDNATGQEERKRLTDEINAQTQSINNNRQALDVMSETTQKVIDALVAEAEARKALQDANRQFAETLLTSGPDELKAMDEALVRANQRLNGFIPQAGASQRKKFFELLKQTGSVKQASQGVAAETRKQDLQFLQQTRGVRQFRLQSEFLNQNLAAGMGQDEARADAVARAERQVRQDEARILAQMGQEAGLGTLGQSIVGQAVATQFDTRNDPFMASIDQSMQNQIVVQRDINTTLQDLNQTLSDLTTVLAGEDYQKKIDGINPNRLPQQKSRGGLIYAADGQYINFEPKGTDTVPAMLTPGEFVVNRSATQKNMGLLQAINGGKVNTYSKGGKVRYLAGGGFSDRDTNKDGVLTVGVEDTSGLNDSNNDGIITLAEFIGNQSLNDPTTRDGVIDSIMKTAANVGSNIGSGSQFGLNLPAANAGSSIGALFGQMFGGLAGAIPGFFAGAAAGAALPMKKFEFQRFGGVRGLLPGGRKFERVGEARKVQRLEARREREKAEKDRQAAIFAERNRRREAAGLPPLENPEERKINFRAKARARREGIPFKDAKAAEEQLQNRIVADPDGAIDPNNGMVAQVRFGDLAPRQQKAVEKRERQAEQARVAREEQRKREKAIAAEKAREQAEIDAAAQQRQKEKDEKARKARQKQIEDSGQGTFKDIYVEERDKEGNITYRPLTEREYRVKKQDPNGPADSQNLYDSRGNRIKNDQDGQRTFEVALARKIEDREYEERYGDPENRRNRFDRDSIDSVDIYGADGNRITDPDTLSQILINHTVIGAGFEANKIPAYDKYGEPIDISKDYDYEQFRKRQTDKRTAEERDRRSALNTYQKYKEDNKQDAEVIDQFFTRENLEPGWQDNFDTKMNRDPDFRAAVEDELARRIQRENLGSQTDIRDQFNRSDNEIFDKFVKGMQDAPGNTDSLLKDYAKIQRNRQERLKSKIQEYTELKKKAFESGEYSLSAPELARYNALRDTELKEAGIGHVIIDSKIIDGNVISPDDLADQFTTYGNPVTDAILGKGKERDKAVEERNRNLSALKQRADDERRYRELLDKQEQEEQANAYANSITGRAESALLSVGLSIVGAPNQMENAALYAAGADPSEYGDPADTSSNYRRDLARLEELRNRRTQSSGLPPKELEELQRLNSELDMPVTDLPGVESNLPKRYVDSRYGAVRFAGYFGDQFYNAGANIAEAGRRGLGALTQSDQEFIEYTDPVTGERVRKKNEWYVDPANEALQRSIYENATKPADLLTPDEIQKRQDKFNKDLIAFQSRIGDYAGYGAYGLGYAADTFVTAGAGQFAMPSELQTADPKFRDDMRLYVLGQLESLQQTGRLASSEDVLARGKSLENEMNAAEQGNYGVGASGAADATLAITEALLPGVPGAIKNTAALPGQAARGTKNVIIEALPGLKDFKRVPRPPVPDGPDIELNSIREILSLDAKKLLSGTATPSDVNPRGMFPTVGAVQEAATGPTRAIPGLGGVRPTTRMPLPGSKPATTAGSELSDEVLAFIDDVGAERSARIESAARQPGLLDDPASIFYRDPYDTVTKAASSSRSSLPDAVNANTPRGKLRVGKELPDASMTPTGPDIDVTDPYLRTMQYTDESLRQSLLKRSGISPEQMSSLSEDQVRDIASRSLDVTRQGGTRDKFIQTQTRQAVATQEITNTQGPDAAALWAEVLDPEKLRQGGMVYANNGALIPFRSRGTDTVPAMLTPGEFVVNREATSKYLPVLRAINSGYNSHNEMVNHLARGGMVRGPQYLQEGGITRQGSNNGVSTISQIQGIEELRAVVNELNQAVSSGTENMNNVATQVTSATNQFASTAQSINSAALNIPDSVNVAQNVRVDGIPDTLNDFSNNLLNSSVAESRRQNQAVDTERNTRNEGADGLPPPSSPIS